MYLACSLHRPAMRPERDVVVGQVRRTGWHRVAWQQVLPTSGCLTHLTAAALHGLWLPPLPEALPVFVSQAKGQARPKRPELRVMRHSRPVEASWYDGLLVASVPQTLLLCARDLSLLDLVVLGDSALHTGLTTMGALHLRVLHRTCGVPVVPQHVVRDGAGRFVARGDLWLLGSQMLHEYDGAGHRDPVTHRDDLRRDRALLAAGWHRRAYTAADLLGRPEAVLRDADATLGRRRRVDRLDPWHAIVAESLFSGSGQDRLRIRLRLPRSGPSLHRHAG